MKFIQVSFGTIDYDSVCQYYNKHKNDNWEPLERLDRAEGGFKIKLNNELADINTTIKQLRWDRRCLKPYMMYPSFSEEEQQLLYKSISSIYGDDSVLIK